MCVVVVAITNRVNNIVLIEDNIHIFRTALCTKYNTSLPAATYNIFFFFYKFYLSLRLCRHAVTCHTYVTHTHTRWTNISHVVSSVLHTPHQQHHRRHPSKNDSRYRFYSTDTHREVVMRATRHNMARFLKRVKHEAFLFKLHN